MSLAPIVLFTYNRLEETKQTVIALQANFLADESELFIFSDAAKSNTGFEKIKEVRSYLKTIKGFKNVTIFEAQENKGLANSIIDGVSQILKQYETVIVVEDDLVSSPNFLDFMNQGLSFYQDDKIIQSVNGFSPLINHQTSDVYFQTRPFPWGWATWKDRWNKDVFDKKAIKLKLNDEVLKDFKKSCGNDISKMLLDSIRNINDSWYVRWSFYHFTNGKKSVYPKFSLIDNVGFGSDGTHCKTINSYKFKLLNKVTRNFHFINYKNLNKKITKEFLNYFSAYHKIKIRFEHLLTSQGRKALKHDFKEKFL